MLWAITGLQKKQERYQVVFLCAPLGNGSVAIIPDCLKFINGMSYSYLCLDKMLPNDTRCSYWCNIEYKFAKIPVRYKAFLHQYKVGKN